MTLLYKEDWDQAMLRYKAWWQQETIGRCAMAVYAPRKNPPPVSNPPEPDTVEGIWTNLDYISACCEYALSQRYFGGEALPMWSGGYPGNKTQAVFMGCEITLNRHTGWVEPILDDRPLEDVFDITYDENEPHFQFAMELLRRGVEQARGKCLVATGAFGGAGDTLAWLRGTEQLLMDLVDCPDVVRDAELYLMKMWCEIFDRFYEIVKDVNQGSTGWFNLWSPGKFYATQNDFAYMISPAMFREIFLPALEMQTEFLDHSLHHVDGVGNFSHVEALCDLPGLNALQILPGANKPSVLHYMDVLKDVQARGKSLHISILPEEVQTAMENLSAKGLFIDTSCETEDEARDLLKKAETWSKD